MTESIIVAIITGIFAVIGNFIVSGTAKRKDDIIRAKRQQEIDDKLKAIETKLDIHNGYAEKFGDIAITLTSLAKDVEYLKRKGE